jgi:hypothetical protein
MYRRYNQTGKANCPPNNIMIKFNINFNKDTVYSTSFTHVQKKDMFPMVSIKIFWGMYRPVQEKKQ